MKIKNYIFLTTICLINIGCVTPQAVTRQANQGILLISEMELSLKEFRKIEGDSERNLINAMKEKHDSLIMSKILLNPDVRASAAAGDVRGQKITSNLRELIKGNIDDEIGLHAESKAYKTKLDLLLSPLPSTATGTASTQEKLAEMGKELSWSDRQKELENLYDFVKKSVDENKDKIKEAEKAKDSE